MPDGPPPRLIVVLAALVAALGCDSQSEAVWSEATPLGVAEGSISGVEVAMNSGGDAMVVWSTRSDGGFEADDYSVWAAPYAPSRGWGDATRISAEGAGAGEPKIAMNDAGQVVVVWYEWASDDEDQSRVGTWVRRFDPVTQWGPPLLLAPDGLDASVALNDDGNAAVAWIESFDRVRVRVLDPSAGWSEPVRLDQPCVPNGVLGDPFLDNSNDFEPSFAVPDQAKNPEVAMNERGQVVVIWDDNESPSGPLALCNQRPSLRASRYSPGQGWGAATDIGVPSSVFGSLHAAVDVDETGRVVAGSQYGSVTSYSEATGWRALDLGVDAPFASVAMANSGYAVAVWEGTDPSRHPDSVVAVRYDPEQGWGEPERFSVAAPSPTDDALAPKSPTILDWASADVAVNELGESLVAWHQIGLPTVRSAFDVWVTQYTVDGGWSTPTPLSTSDSVDAMLPRVVIDSTGRGIAMWRESENAGDWRAPVRLMWSRLE